MRTIFVKEDSNVWDLGGGKIMNIPSDKFDSFGKRIEFIRCLCDMTQQQIAEAIGVSVGTWQRFVYGKSDMRRDTLKRFIEATGVDRDWIEGYTDTLTITVKGASSKSASRPSGRVAYLAGRPRR